MEKIIIHGMGIGLHITRNYLKKHEDQFEIVELWDNNKNIWGKNVVIFHSEFQVKQPHPIEKDINVIISSDLYFAEISYGLNKEYGILFEQMKRSGWLLNREKKALIDKYSNSYNPRIREALHFIKNNPERTVVYNQPNLDVYNRDYNLIKINIEFDSEAGLFFSYWYGKRLYMKRSLNTYDQVKRYITGLYKEQDLDSPHYYGKDGYKVKKGDVILDGGAAEGFWALENIEKAEYVYLIENNKEWLEALQYTFKDYQDKICIVSKLLGDHSDEEYITIDELNRENKINCIKLDIEGAEIPALHGGTETLSQDNIVMCICTYHKEKDMEQCESILHSYGFETGKNDGVMWFIHDHDNMISLRNGVLYGRKGRTPKVYIWGAGNRCKYIYDAIKINNCRLMGIVDSDYQKQYMIYKNVLVCPPKDVVRNADYVIISEYDDVLIDEIKKQCIEMGYQKEQVIAFWKDDIMDLDFINESIKEMKLLQYSKIEK